MHPEQSQLSFYANQSQVMIIPAIYPKSIDESSSDSEAAHSKPESVEEYLEMTPISDIIQLQALTRPTIVLESAKPTSYASTPDQEIYVDERRQLVSYNAVQKPTTVIEIVSTDKTSVISLPVPTYNIDITAQVTDHLSVSDSDPSSE